MTPSTQKTPLPVDFQFSQGSLQDFAGCPRRFQLRYLMRLAWPAPVAEPAGEYERQIENGEAFHRLVHQHILGIPAGRLWRAIPEDETGLLRWWQNYLDAAPADIPGALRYPELGLSTALGGYRLVARYDLVAAIPGQQATILDWKTGDRRPSRNTLALRLQTRVYRYVLVQAGARFNGGAPWQPEQVKMVYWFAGHPEEPEAFGYDAGQHGADRRYLEGLIGEIAHMSATTAGPFPTASDDTGCRYCCYRSLCDRGDRAGPCEEMEDLSAPDAGALDLDLEQIGEIAY